MFVHMCGTLTDSLLYLPFLSRTIASQFSPNGGRSSEAVRLVQIPVVVQDGLN